MWVSCSNDLETWCVPQAAADLPEDASFEEYLARPPPHDTVEETFLDPLSLGGAPGKAPPADAEVRSSTRFPGHFYA